MKKVLRIGLALLTLCLLGLTLTAMYAPESFRRDLVMRFSLEEREPGVWCRPQMSTQDFSAWMAVLGQAKEQAAPWCPQGLVPKSDILFADTGEMKKQLAVGNPFAKSLFHRDQVLAIVGPRGNTKDVMAHLLVHVAVKQELGEERFDALPNWFDEGLAAQVDERLFLQQEALDALPLPDQPFAVDARPGAELFQGDEGEHQLALAKRQHRVWSRNRGPEASWALLRAFAAGEAFTPLYSATGEAAAD